MPNAHFQNYKDAQTKKLTKNCNIFPMKFPVHGAIHKNLNSHRPGDMVA